MRFSSFLGRFRPLVTCGTDASFNARSERCRCTTRRPSSWCRPGWRWSSTARTFLGSAPCSSRAPLCLLHQNLALSFVLLTALVDPQLPPQDVRPWRGELYPLTKAGASRRPWPPERLSRPSTADHPCRAKSSTTTRCDRLRMAPRTSSRQRRLPTRLWSLAFPLKAVDRLGNIRSRGCTLGSYCIA